MKRLKAKLLTFRLVARKADKSSRISTVSWMLIIDYETLKQHGRKQLTTRKLYEDEKWGNNGNLESGEERRKRRRRQKAMNDFEAELASHDARPRHSQAFRVRLTIVVLEVNAAIVCGPANVQLLNKPQS